MNVATVAMTDPVRLLVLLPQFLPFEVEELGVGRKDQAQSGHSGLPWMVCTQQEKPLPSSKWVQCVGVSENPDEIPEHKQKFSVHVQVE
jgi:hypothetical protein